MSKKPKLPEDDPPLEGFENDEHKVMDDRPDHPVPTKEEMEQLTFEEFVEKHPALRFGDKED